MQRYLRMPGRKSVAHSKFAQWRIEQGYSTYRFAEVTGMSRTTVWKLSQGLPVSRMVARIIRSIFPDCPVFPTRGKPQEYFEQLPATPQCPPKTRSKQRTRNIAKWAARDSPPVQKPPSI